MIAYIRKVKNWKSIAFFILLLSVLFTTENAASATIPSNFPDQKEGQFSKESIHLSAILRTESMHSFVPNFKAGSSIVFLRITDEITFYPRGFKSKKLQKSFSRQDINRCEKVSIHLFPYHFFW